VFKEEVLIGPWQGEGRGAHGRVRAGAGC